MTVRRRKGKFYCMNYWKVKKVLESPRDLEPIGQEGLAPPLCLGLQVIIHYKYKPKIHCFSSLVHIVLGVFLSSSSLAKIDQPNPLGNRNF